MFNNFFSFTPTLSENGSYYIVSGVNFKDFENDLKSTYGTTVISNRIINRISSSRFRIHKFFTVELTWILDDLINKQASSKQKHYRVGINKYRALYELVKTNTWISSTFQDYEPYNLNAALKGFKIKPYPDQQAFLENYKTIKLGFQLKGCLLDASPGSGKANWIGSKILTPNGFVKMGDIKIGDLVIDKNGLPTKVDAVYPQGKKQLYKITFEDGRSEEVCEEHLWSIRYNGKKSLTDTKTLITYLSKNTNPIYTPLMGNKYNGYISKSKLEEDPYAFGLSISDKKIIPKEYLNSSAEARLQLLHGLLYSIGTVKRKNEIFYTAFSKSLAIQIQYLIRSLGGIAFLKPHFPIINYNGGLKKGNVEYKVIIKFKDDNSLSKFMDSKAFFKEDYFLSDPFIKIVSIEPSRVDYAQCISVSSPDSLYVCGDFIVTHNTPTSLMWSRMVSKEKTIILVPKHLIEDPWVDHLNPNGERYCFSTPPKYWLSTGNVDPLKSDAEFFIFYTEQLRKDNWKGIPFIKIIDKLSKSGSEPIKMIIDESHNYNDFSSQQTRGMVEFASNSNISDVLFMSGTPLKAQGKETYPMFIVLDKYFDSNIREDFKKMYSRDNFFLNEMLAHRLGRIKFTINSILGMENPPEPEILPIKFPSAEKYTLKNIRAEMVSYIQERALFYQKNMGNYLYDWNEYLNDYEERISGDKELLSELAQYKNTVDYFRKNGFNTFTDTDKSKFCKIVESKIEENLHGEDLKYFRHIVPAIKYLQLKIKGEALGNVLGKARIGAIIDMIEYLDLAQIVKTGIKKTAIYSTYIEAINAAYNKLERDGCNPLKLHSQTNMNVNEVITKLRTPQFDSLVTSYDTLSEGTPLLMMNQLVLLNAPWREYILKQCIARIFRRGQDAPCFVWLLDLDTGKEENITTRTIDIMSYFKEQVDQLLNGGIGFDSIEGTSLKLTDSAEYKFEDLVPFDIPIFKYRPKPKDRSFSSLFR